MSERKAIAIVAAIALVALAIFAVHTYRVDSARRQSPEYLHSESSEAGVVVHGYCTMGWIQNTNDFPVNIKQVWVYKEAERTVWSKEFPPGKKLEQPYISHQHRFYVYNMDGGEIACITPVKNWEAG
jgi:hypothetical protein